MMREEEGTLLKIPKVDIYFHYMNDEWYSFKASSCYSVPPEGWGLDSQRAPDLEPALPQLPEKIHAPTYAPLGSFIYVSGGLVDGPLESMYSTKVFYIDTLHLGEGWRAAPPMNTARYHHSMLADAGKMYVLGGLDIFHRPDPTEGKTIFAEVYDPSNPDAGWKPLARAEKDEIPQQLNGHAFVEEHDGPSDRKILFYECYNKNLFYLTLTRQDDVGIYDENFGRVHSSSVSVDGVFYFLPPSNIFYAYDIFASSSKKRRVYLRDLKADTLPHKDHYEESWPLSRLLSLGNGHLALIWMKDPEYVGSYTIHCSIIKMSRVGDSFEGQVVNYSSHSVKSGGFLRSCMAVCSPEEEDLGLDTKRFKNTKRSASSI